MEHPLLETAVTEALRGRGDAKHLTFFIKRTLRQFQLDTQYQEMEILIEAYLRAQKKVDSGEAIENLPGWLKTTSYNIVREKSKKRKREESLKTHLINNSHGVEEIDNSWESDHTDKEKIKALIKSFQSLSSEDKDILTLRIVKGFSWEEVTAHLNSQEETNISTATFRKRGERALNRICKSFFSTHPDGK
jgi:DNA-directed RNA polymerase specialized sigma24 family protein